MTLEQDLERRDLTVNAIARDPQTHELIDPFNGKARSGRAAYCGMCRRRSSKIRCGYCASRALPRALQPLGFTVAPETIALMQDIAAKGELAALVPERVWQETQRALEQTCTVGLLRSAARGDALPIVFPEVAALFGVPQPEKWHPEIDTGVHTMMVLQQATRLSEDPIVRFAALTHDLGKGTTPPDEWPRHIAHEQRSVALIEALCQRLRIPNSYRDVAVLVGRYHLLSHKLMELRAFDPARTAGTSRCVSTTGAGRTVHRWPAKPTRAVARGWKIATIRSRMYCARAREVPRRHRSEKPNAKDWTVRDRGAPA